MRRACVLVHGGKRGRCLLEPGPWQKKGSWAGRPGATGSRKEGRSGRAPATPGKAGQGAALGLSRWPGIGGETPAWAGLASWAWPVLSFTLCHHSLKILNNFWTNPAFEFCTGHWRLCSRCREHGFPTSALSHRAHQRPPTEGISQGLKRAICFKAPFYFPFAWEAKGVKD